MSGHTPPIQSTEAQGSADDDREMILDNLMCRMPAPSPAAPEMVLCPACKKPYQKRNGYGAHWAQKHSRGGLIPKPPGLPVDASRGDSR